MEGISGMNAWELIRAGGALMAPILLCSLFALGIVIEKMLHFSTVQTNGPRLKTKVFDLIKDNQIKEAIQLCDADPSLVAKVLRAGVLKFGAPREEIKESMEDAGLLEIPKLESRLGAPGDDRAGFTSFGIFGDCDRDDDLLSYDPGAGGIFEPRYRR